MATASTIVMIPVLTTAVILLLYCSLFQTNADGHVTSNDPSGDVSDKARARSIRQIPMCQDEFETLKNTAYSTQAGYSKRADGNVSVPRQCLDWCMQNVNCVSAMHTKGAIMDMSMCFYTETLTTIKTATSLSRNTYFKIIFRCPKHYRCRDTPCQNGATCINATTSGRGVTCICADGWKSWFCEKRQTCLDHICQNGATCRYTEKVGITCSCPAGYDGLYCQWPPTTTATTITTTSTTTIITTEDKSTGMSANEKTLVVAGVAAGIVFTCVAAAAVIGAAASTTRAAAATTGGTTVVTRYVM